MPLALEEARGLIDAYRKANAEVAQWTDARDLLRRRIEILMGDEEEATINGEVAVTHRRNGQFAERKFQNDRPDLVEKYMTLVTVPRLDVDAIRRELPETYAAYRARPFVVK